MNLKQLCDRAEYLLQMVTGMIELDADTDDLEKSDHELVQEWLDEYDDWKRQLSLEKVTH